MALSERVTTEILISATSDTNHTRIGMAVLYALGIKDALSSIDWPRVNKAILARWSRAGFMYIRRHAWGIVAQALLPLRRTRSRKPDRKSEPVF